MNPRTKKFLSYYKPYLRLFFSVLICAFLVAAITLIFPLCIRYITKNVLEGHLPDATNQIFQIGAFMLALVVAPDCLQLLRGLSRSCHGGHDGKRHAQRTVRPFSKIIISFL